MASVASLAVTLPTCAVKNDGLVRNLASSAVCDQRHDAVPVFQQRANLGSSFIPGCRLTAKASSSHRTKRATPAFAVVAEAGTKAGTQTWHFVVANSDFMLNEEEEMQEIFKERVVYYKEQNKERDFFIVHEPAFVETLPEDIKRRIRRPCTAIISPDEVWITFMKLRLDKVYMGSFEAPSAAVPNPFASTKPVGSFPKPDKWTAPYSKYPSGWWKAYEKQ
eukprot:jgi/Mesvir1/15660/Mv03264-RA.1